MPKSMKFELKICFFDTDTIVKGNKVEELYLVMGKCVCTSVTDLLFMNVVLWLFLLTVMAGLTGVQLSGTCEKVI